MLESHSLSRALGLVNCAKHLIIGPTAWARPDPAHPVQFVGVGPDHPVTARRRQLPRMDPADADPAV